MNGNGEIPNNNPSSYENKPLPRALMDMVGGVIKKWADRLPINNPIVVGFF